MDESTSSGGYQIELASVSSGYDGEWFWVHARPGIVPSPEPDAPPLVVVPTHPCARRGPVNDFFDVMHSFRSADLGETWQGPFKHSEAFEPVYQPNGDRCLFCDPVPQFHRASGKLLMTGGVVRYSDQDAKLTGTPQGIPWSVYDCKTHTWSRWRTFEIPGEPRLKAVSAGCVQRHDLEDGSLLLPVTGRALGGDKKSPRHATVLRCAFDGETIRYLEHGNLFTLPDARGACEPSLTRFGDRFYLTLRNDVRGYVACSHDGLHFEEPRPWAFDDGREIGNYNTQQHWVTHSDGLSLAYTRRGLDNDHVIRHQAPLLMARVDPETITLIRDTEQILVPNRGARLGNFGTANITPTESWVMVSEWMKPIGCEQYGSDNTIWFARLKWDRRNRLV